MSYREEIVAVANAPAPKRRNRWRWVWRVALGLFLATASAIIGYIIDWKRTRHDGDAKLAAITTRLDADEPGWRFEAILADHNSKVPPPETNSALKAVAIVDRFPKSADPERSPAALLSKINDGRYPNELPNAALWVELESNYRAHEKGISELRAWNATTPRGRFKSEYQGGNPFNTFHTDTQKLRNPPLKLAWDAMRSAYRGQPDRALASATASLHLIRSIDFEPMVITYLVRIVTPVPAFDSIEQTLAWCSTSSDPALASLQELVGQERNSVSMRAALQGERGLMIHGLEMYDRGEITIFDVKSKLWNLDTLHDNQHLPNNIAFILERCDEFLSMIDLPPDQKATAIRGYRFPPRTKETTIGYLYLPSVNKVLMAEIRYQANCVCTEVGIACERYRLKNGRWPNALDDLHSFGIAKGIVDPFDGQPLRYRVETDGVSVYSIGTNGIDDGGDIVRREGSPDDVGFRLWNVPNRKVPMAKLRDLDLEFDEPPPRPE